MRKNLTLRIAKAWIKSLYSIGLASWLFPILTTYKTSAGQYYNRLRPTRNIFKY